MYKGQLEGFRKEIVEKMLEYQVAQGNKKDITVFEKNITASKNLGGFDWIETKDGCNFWDFVLRLERFDIFFNEYPSFITQCVDFKSKLDLEILKTETSEKRNKLCDINLLLLSLINDF